MRQPSRACCRSSPVKASMERGVKRLFFSLSVFILAAASAVPALCGDKTIVLTTLEWPPYTGTQLPGEGMSSEVVRAAFEAVGYTVEIRFYPWKRAVEHGRHDFDVDGYFPEYVSAERKKYFLFSDPIGASPLGFVEKKSKPVHWETLQDLSETPIGTVQGYVNTDEFDRLAARGKLLVDSSVSDLLNLRKVLAGRLALAVVDVNVFQYLTSNDEHLRQDWGKLQVNPHLLGVNTLHVCFRKGRKGETYLRDFNEGLRRITVSEMERRYLKDIYLLDQ